MIHAIVVPDAGAQWPNASVAASNRKCLQKTSATVAVGRSVCAAARRVLRPKDHGQKNVVNHRISRTVTDAVEDAKIRTNGVRNR